MDSIPKQYPILVVDSGSTPDNYEKILAACEARSATLYLFYHPELKTVNNILYNAKNYLMQFVETEYVIFNDGDFMYLPGAIEESLKIFKALPDAGLLGHYSAPGNIWGDMSPTTVYPDQYTVGHQILQHVMVGGVEICEVNTITGMSTLNTVQMWEEVGGWPIPIYSRWAKCPGCTGDGDFAIAIHNAGKKLYIPYEKVWGVEI